MIEFLEANGSPCSLHAVLKEVRVRVDPNFTADALLEVIQRMGSQRMSFDREEGVHLLEVVAAKRPHRSITGWRAHKAELERLMMDPAVEAIRVRLRLEGRVESRVRVDRVLLSGRGALVATFRADDEAFNALYDLGAAEISELLAPSKRTNSDLRLNWTSIRAFRSATPEDMSVALVRAGMIALQTQADRMNIRSEECTPKELERRMQLWAPTSHAKRAPARGPTLTHCKACGQPLTDNQSAQRGFGPECWRRHTKRERLISAPNARRDLVTVASKSQHHWLAEISEEMSKFGWLSART